MMPIAVPESPELTWWKAREDGICDAADNPNPKELPPLTVKKR
jgi:hypothetical protein